MLLGLWNSRERPILKTLNVKNFEWNRIEWKSKTHKVDPQKIRFCAPNGQGLRFHEEPIMETKRTKQETLSNPKKKNRTLQIIWITTYNKTIGIWKQSCTKSNLESTKDAQLNNSILLHLNNPHYNWSLAHPSRVGFEFHFSTTKYCTL